MYINIWVHIYRYTYIYMRNIYIYIIFIFIYMYAYRSQLSTPAPLIDAHMRHFWPAGATWREGSQFIASEPGIFIIFAISISVRRMHQPAGFFSECKKCEKPLLVQPYGYVPLWHVLIRSY
jgi:hypothetical protein